MIKILQLGKYKSLFYSIYWSKLIKFLKMRFIKIKAWLNLPLLASLVSLSVSTKIFIFKRLLISLLYKARIPSKIITSAGYTTWHSDSLVKSRNFS